MFASTIIPVYNRRQYIVRCLESLFQQSYSLFEIIVVDDGSTDGTGKVLQDIQDPRLKVFYLTENRGPSFTRNFALEKAKGEIIALIDSDCVAHEDWLKEILKPFSYDPAIKIVGGKIEDPPISNYWELVNKGGDFVANHTGYVTKVIGCNMAFKREKASNKPFDERISHITSEDFDLCLRYLNQGYSIFYNSSAKVTHHRRSNFRSTIIQQFNYGFGNAYTLIKNRRHPFINYGSWILIGVIMNLFLGIFVQYGFYLISALFFLIYCFLIFYVSIRSGDKTWPEAVMTYPGFFYKMPCQFFRKCVFCYPCSQKKF